MLRIASPLSADEERVVAAAVDCGYAVHRALGPGFRESIYQRAYCLELEWRRIPFEREKPVTVRYRTSTIPGQKVDLLVGQVVVVEIKSVTRLAGVHVAQVLSYIKTMDLRVGLLMNFNCQTFKDGVRRIVR